MLHSLPKRSSCTTIFCAVGPPQAAPWVDCTFVRDLDKRIARVDVAAPSMPSWVTAIAAVCWRVIRLEGLRTPAPRVGESINAQR